MRHLRYSMKNSILLLFLLLVSCVVNSCKFCPDEPDIVVQYLDKPLVFKVHPKFSNNISNKIHVVCKGNITEVLDIKIDNQIKPIGHHIFTVSLPKGTISYDEWHDFYSNIPALITLKPSKKLKGNLDLLLDNSITKSRALSRFFLFCGTYWP